MVSQGIMLLPSSGFILPCGLKVDAVLPAERSGKTEEKAFQLLKSPGLEKTRSCPFTFFLSGFWNMITWPNASLAAVGWGVGGASEWSLLVHCLCMQLYQGQWQHDAW